MNDDTTKALDRIAQKMDDLESLKAAVRVLMDEHAIVVERNKHLVAQMKSMVEGGEHLGVVRNWIKWHAHNGSTVTWGSEQMLQGVSVSVGDMERLAQAIANGERKNLCEKIRSKGGELELMNYGNATALVAISMTVSCILSELEDK